MIQIMKNSGIELTTIKEPIRDSWLNIVNPSPDELSNLEALGIPRDYLLYPLDIDELSRLERENGELLIVVRIPHYQGSEADVPYITIPLGIIRTEHYLLTVCKRDNEILDEFVSGQIKGLSVTKRNRFILRLLLRTAYKYLAYLQEINKVVDKLEDQLQLSTRNKEVLELLKYQKSLTYFTTALKSNELMVERLQRSQLLTTYSDDQDLLEDVLIENRQAIEMTNIASNILSSMMDAFASIISNNLNRVMKLLASITIVLSLPIMVASFYGMNVILPMQENPNAFFYTLAVSFMITLSVVVLFWKRDWF